MPTYSEVKQKIDEIECELKRINRWQDSPLPPEKFENMGPFGMNTMAPEQWIQFVLIPRVSQIIAQQGRFPDQSQVGVWAYRNFDGDDEALHLCSLLSEFDDLFVQMQ